MKKILAQIPLQIDHAWRQKAATAARTAQALRIFFCVLFAVAALWSADETGLFIYAPLAVLWLFAASLFGLLQKADVFILGAWLDVAILSLGLLLCAWFGVFNAKGFLVLLAYFPVLALAARRGNLLLVWQLGAGIVVFYALLSLWTLGSPALPRLLAISAMTFVAGSLTRKPHTEMTAVAQTAAQEAYELGASEKEAELMSVVHQQFFPPAQYELPGLYASYKHGVGTATSGDFYHAMETARGPLVLLGDLPGKGLDAALTATRLQNFLSELVQEKDSLGDILTELNAALWQRNQTVTCVLARWEGTQLHYLNAGHLPAIHVSKREAELLPVNAQPLGTTEQWTGTEAVLDFPKGDLLVLYTDGAYAGLASERTAGAWEMRRMAEQFSGGEVNTLCHRLFDCGQPEYTQAPDDSTVVVVRRQEFATEANG